MGEVGGVGGVCGRGGKAKGWKERHLGRVGAQGREV